MVEKRLSQRQRVLKAGTISFGGGVIDCTIKNWSKAGAALDVASPIGVPEQFTLIGHDDRKLACRIIWRSPARIGVAFVGR